MMSAAMTRLAATHCLAYGDANRLDRQLCEFLLRGIGLTEAAIASHLDRQLTPAMAQSAIAESA